MDNETLPIFVISVAAQLSGMHPQTLRQYDRLGLVCPSRAPGRSRRYSQENIVTLQQIQKMSNEGYSLQGIKRVLELEVEVKNLREKVKQLNIQLQQKALLEQFDTRVFAAGSAGDVVTMMRGERPRARSSALVLWVGQSREFYLS